MKTQTKKNKTSKITKKILQRNLRKGGTDHRNSLAVFKSFPTDQNET